MTPSKRLGSVLALIVALLCAGTVRAEEPNRDYRPLPLELEGVSGALQPADLNGDGRLDLLTADGEQLKVYLQQDSDPAFRFGEAQASLTLPGSATGWTLAPGDHGQRLLALVDGRELHAWDWGEDGFAESRVLAAGLQGFLPSGAHRLEFMRDINGDGEMDLIVPGLRQLQLYLRNEDGSFAEPLPVQSRLYSYTRVRGGENLNRRVGQRLRLPDLRIRDSNGDDRPDLVAGSEEGLEVWLADADGAYPRRASYRLDLRQVREDVGEVDLERIDWSNLSGLLAHTYSLDMTDVDGDGVDDLLLREGGRITLYGGGPEGVDLEEPRQVLKSGGNVLGVTLKDEDGDGLEDLWLARVEDVSLANLFLWLAISGSVDVENFVYRNRGERFASRPHRKLTVSVKFPSILRSVELVGNAMEDKLAADTVLRSARATLGSGGEPRDLAVLERHGLAVHLGVIAESGEGEGFLGLNNYSRERDRYVYDLGGILENPAPELNVDLARVDGREPDFRIAFPEDFRPDLQDADLLARDFNGDGRDDFIVFSEREDDTLRGLLLLSRE